MIMLENTSVNEKNSNEKTFFDLENSIAVQKPGIKEYVSYGELVVNDKQTLKDLIFALMVNGDSDLRRHNLIGIYSQVVANDKVHLRSTASDIIVKDNKVVLYDNLEDGDDDIVFCDEVSISSNYLHLINLFISLLGNDFDIEDYKDDERAFCFIKRGIFKRMDVKEAWVNFANDIKILFDGSKIEFPDDNYLRAFCNYVLFSSILGKNLIMTEEIAGNYGDDYENKAIVFRERAQLTHNKNLDGRLTLLNSKIIFSDCYDLIDDYNDCKRKANKKKRKIIKFNSI